MKKVAFIAVILFFHFHALRGAPPADLIRKQLASPGKDSVAALDTVLKNAGAISSITMLMASRVAYREKRLEDAGFLVYAAELRYYLDDAVFTSSGNSSGADHDDMTSKIYGPDSAKVMIETANDPKLFAKVLARFKTWNPAFPEGYNPGWSFDKKGSPADVKKYTAREKANFEKKLGDVSVLLQDPEYRAAYKICLAGLNGVGSRYSDEVYNTNRKTLDRIEKKEGRHGLGWEIEGL